MLNLILRNTTTITNVIHLVVLGQSQAGGQDSDPALTTSTLDGCRTLTGGPIDVNTNGGLILLEEGDTFTDTPGGPFTDVETIATSMAQQLKTWMGDNYEFVVTVHATGSTTIQQLGKGGDGRYEEALDAMTRVKTLVEAEGKKYNCHLVWFHGGSGDNVGSTYKSKVLDLVNDFVTDAASYTSDPVYVFTAQQRVSGTPDYGIQLYEASLEDARLVVCGSVYKAAHQGDNIHLTNHGTRYMAMIFARGIRKKLNGTFEPLELDIASASFNTTTLVLTIPVLNGIGSIGGSSNFGIEVYSNTTSAVLTTTTIVSGGNIQITFAVDANGLVPIGLHNLLIRTAISANGELRDSSSSVDIPDFQDGSSNPYNLDKYVVRAEHAITLTFPVNAILAFGGNGNSLTNPEPTVSGVRTVWGDNVQDFNTVNYLISGNVSIDYLSTASNYFGFADANTQDSGLNTLTGTNLYANEALRSYMFVDGRSVDSRLNGLNPAKTYTLKFASLRTGTGTNRQTTITIGGNSITKTSNRAGTASVFTTEAEMAVFNAIAPNVSGQITFTVNTNGTQFGYLNLIEVIES